MHRCTQWPGFFCDSTVDYLEVTVDGNQVFLVNGGSPLCGSSLP